MTDIWAGISIGVIITLFFNGAINSVYIIWFKEDFENILRKIREKWIRRKEKIKFKFLEKRNKVMEKMKNENKNSLL